MNFDLILIYTNFRRHEAYLNICKYLSNNSRVGIYLFGNPSEFEETDQLYLEKCLSFGAKVVEGDAQTKALVLPRFGKGFKDKIYHEVPKRIKYDRLLILTDSFMSGVPFINETFQHLGPAKILAVSKDHFGLIEPDTKQFVQTHNLEIIECGVPFKKYPAFEPIKIDYLLAYPSHVSTPSITHEYQVIRNLYKSIKSIPRDKKIFVKVHNVRKSGNRLSATFFYSRYPRLKFLMPFFLSFSALLDLKIAGKPLFKFAPNRVLEPLKKVQNDYIFFNSQDILKFYPPFGIEHFLAFVKEGVITGLSNTIPVSLLLKIPVMNVDSHFNETDPNRLIMIDALGIRKWNGFYSGNSGQFEERTKNVDYIETIKTAAGIQ